jgi:hypothetical protein
MTIWPIHIPQTSHQPLDLHTGYSVHELPDDACRSCTVFHETGPLRECVVPNFPAVIPETPSMSQAERDGRAARIRARQAFLDYIGPVLHGGAWDGHPMATHCTVIDNELTMEPLI